MKNKWQQSIVELPNAESGKAVPIIADGGIATVNLGDGRNIPVLIIDTSKRPDIVDLVNAHKELPPGDVKSMWGKRSKSNKFISLILTFEKPSHAVVVLDFDIVKQGILVEQIVTTQALYLQPGHYGDKVSTTLDKSKIIVEVRNTGFREKWNEIFQDELVTHFRKNGLSRKSSVEVAKNVISSLRLLVDFRIRK